MIDVVNRSVRAIPNWVLYVAGAVPVIWLYVLGFQNALGADPVDAIERNLGLWALWLLIAGLCITPLQRLTPLRLIKLRRPIGVVAFFYVLVHFLTWLVLDVQIPSQIVADIIKRPYVTVGMAALLLLLPLAVTSNNWSIRKMGARWRTVHKLVYPAVLLAGLHMVMQAKGFQLEPLVYLAAIAFLVAMRWMPLSSFRQAFVKR
ncbi:protein-methionine-sulfoxide reductase heme-binding subunit MsrQ [Donghicola eburneus]|uniref:Protein-methionine-sulfoxide reductase heme-binding subunit MsrQ n=1 Tax=Donghicola eburneus TaxID=393278 RepID=A0A1M4N481_9RHOB|nr:protein-methionine-sulfoxide reductase heme-binding subunit MsrQ [Donghicola eburneus]SCM69641.1 putative membrane protein [Donghicola eburneus]SFQ49470.1 sulfoxide reductase heme-binding subunit YedZ [Donghicola eburneus]